MRHIWGWNSTNCWAGAISAFVAASMRLVSGMRPDLDMGSLLPDTPLEVSVVVTAVLGGASGLLGALLVDWVKPDA